MLKHQSILTLEFFDTFHCASCASTLTSFFPSHSCAIFPRDVPGGILSKLEDEDVDESVYGVYEGDGVRWQEEVHWWPPVGGVCRSSSLGEHLLGAPEVDPGPRPRLLHPLLPPRPPPLLSLHLTRLEAACRGVRGGAGANAERWNAGYCVTCCKRSCPHLVRCAAFKLGHLTVLGC